MTYRAEVVGSLLRPTYLAEARKQFEAGQLDAAAFKAIEDQAVNEAIALQEATGIDIITDGELRRYAFYGHLIDSVTGFDKYAGWAIAFRNEAGEELRLKRPVVTEKLQWKRSMCAEEWVYLRSRTTRPGKVTMISAQQAAAYYDPEQSKAAYPTRDAYLADIVDFSRREVDELIRLGCTYIQIEESVFSASRRTNGCAAFSPRHVREERLGITWAAWRTEPEIDAERQKLLANRRAIQPTYDTNVRHTYGSSLSSQTLGARLPYASGGRLRCS